MEFTHWFAVIGALLIFAVIVRSFAQRLLLNTTMLYLVVGFALGPYGAGLIRISPAENSWFLERLAEIAVIISLFTAGLKLGARLSIADWLLPVRLAFVSVAVMVGLIALVAYVALDLPLGAAILLGAVLAPTDPVLASEVQLKDHRDRDRLRFTLTAEASLNDGSAFPFVMLGLGLMGLHELGDWGWQWVLKDVLWASAVGLVIGAVLGHLVGRLVVYLRAQRHEAVGLDEFLALGVIALSYGLTLMAHGYGFLAVFAAGLALRHVERSRVPHPESPTPSLPMADSEAEDVATHPDTAPAYMMRAVLSFNEQTERFGELIVVLFVGAMLSGGPYLGFLLWFVPLLFFVLRPLAVAVGKAGVRLPRMESAMIHWFGIRGLGSVYYLAYAAQNGLPVEYTEQFTQIVLGVVAASVVLHGVSVAPLMGQYTRLKAAPSKAGKGGD